MDAFTYHIWMNSYSCLNDIGEIERIYEEMKRLGKICWRTYSGLVAIYMKTKLTKKAESVLNRLEEEVNPRQRDA